MSTTAIDETEVGHRVKLGIAKAIEASFRSNCPHYMVGAVLMRRGRVVNAGWNWFKKSAPDSKTRHHGLHAEFCAVRHYSKRKEFQSGYDLDSLSGCTMFVARTTRTGRVAMSKPCEGCQNLLRLLNLRKVYYTNETGGISELAL
jgi:deoxycytidylate deaminase